MNARALILGIVIAGCSGAPLPTDFARAQTLESTDPERARAMYEAVDTRCKSEKLAHDDCALAVERLAELDAEDGRFAQSRDRWLRVAEVAKDRQRAARGIERAARITHEELHDDTTASALAWRCVESYPDEIAAGDALALAVRVDDARDWQALAARLAALYPRVVKFDVADNVLFERGMVLARHGDSAHAVAVFDELADAFPRSSLRDDGLWRAAELLRGSGDFDGALTRLRRILATRKDALITGSYNYLQLDDAQLMVGRIYLDDLHDPARAAEAFQLLADDYPESTLRDDALYDLARAKHAAHDDGAACRALGRLVKQFPDGNRFRAARTMMQELACS